MALCPVESHDRERLTIVVILRILEAFDCDFDLLFFTRLDEKWLGEALSIRKHHLARRVVDTRRFLQNRFEVVVPCIHCDFERPFLGIGGDFCRVADYHSAVCFQAVLEAERNRADGLEARAALGSRQAILGAVERVRNVRLNLQVAGITVERVLLAAIAVDDNLYIAGRLGRSGVQDTAHLDLESFQGWNGSLQSGHHRHSPCFGRCR